MSDKEPKEPEVKTEVVTETIKVEVDRSKIEQDLQKELEDKESDLRQRNEKFADLEKELNTLKTAQEADTTKYNKILVERDKLKEDWKKIAEDKFKEVKAEKFELYKSLGIDDDKLAELDEQIQTPADLSEKEWMLGFLAEQLQKAAKEREKEPNEPKPNEPTNPTNPPPGSVVTLPKPPAPKTGEVQTAREGIDKLYAAEAEGDAVATKNLNALWQKFAPTVRTQRTTFGIIQCPICEMGVLQGEICPICGWDQKIWKIKGGDIF